MAFINIQKHIEDSVFEYEKKLKSPINKFLDTTPMYVTYYHINESVTTTDAGFIDGMSLIGSQSPIRYNLVKNMPLYIPDTIQLQLSEMDQGFDTSFEGEATILPGDLKPLPDDLFIINVLKDTYLFRVTEITYDAIMADGFYKIQFKLESNDGDEIKKLQEQITGKFDYIVKNVGTEQRCIVESEYVEEINALESMYSDIVETYKTIFYNERYNCFLGELGAHQKLYDPFMTQFINSHSIFNRKDTYDSLILTDHYPNDNHRQIKYEKSVFRFLERRNKDLAKNFKFDTFLGCDIKNSAFDRWHDDSVWIADIPSIYSKDAIDIFSNEFVAAIMYNTPTESAHAELIKKFSRKEAIGLTEIPLDLNEELLSLEASIEVFFVTPMILYIIRTTINEFLTSRDPAMNNVKL